MTMADRILFGLVLAGLVLLWAGRLPAGPASAVEVWRAGAAPQQYSLATDRTLRLAGRLGESEIRIHSGAVRFVHSPCSGKICIHSGWLRRSGEAAACLPNGVSLRLVGAEPAYDAINF